MLTNDIYFILQGVPVDILISNQSFRTGVRNLGTNPTLQKNTNQDCKNLSQLWQYQTGIIFISIFGSICPPPQYD